MITEAANQGRKFPRCRRRATPEGNPVEPPVARQKKVSTTDPDSTYASGPARLGKSPLHSKPLNERTALAVLGKLDGAHASRVPVRTISVAVRKRIAGQRARWVKVTGLVTIPKRTMSAKSRAKIAAAQRRRWAKVRAKQKV